MERVPYDNHERKLNFTTIKHHLAALLQRAGLRLEFLEQRLLFSPSKDILVCKTCGYGRYEQTFDIGVLERYYGHRYFLAGGLTRERWNDFEYVSEHSKTQGQWAFVSPHLKAMSHVRMLDIGAAASRMSRMAKHHLGERMECSVIEPGDGWVDYYQNHGFNLAARFFPANNGKSYDYVHTSHWLEHVDKLEPVLQGLRQSTTEGGLCFIEVPNCDETYFSRSFPDSPHIHFFTKQSLRIAMEQHGFAVVDIRECAMPNPAYYDYRRRTALLTPAEQYTAEVTEASIEQVAGGNLLRGLFRAVS